MRNADFIKLVIRCKDCIHRNTFCCPMFFFDSFDVAYDKTEDEGFCWEGETK